MRIAIGGIVHETNTYCTARTTLQDFSVLEGERLYRLAGTETQSGAALDLCAERGWTAIPLLYAWTQPSGTIDRESYEEMKGRLLSRLAEALPVDGVFLDLHGAGVVDGIDDLEGDLANAVRDLLGPGVPLTAAFDLHGNITQAMADALDGVFACHEYPHIDQHLRAREAVAFLETLAKAPKGTTVQVASLPLLMPTTTTFHGIGAELRDRLKAAEAEDPAVANVSFFHGFPYCDVPQVGCHVVVTHWGTAEVARTLARRLAGDIWARREALSAQSLSAEEAVAHAQAAAQVDGSGPVVINETSDNCGGGSPGDGTHLLRALLEAKVQNACFGFIVDPEVAEAAHRAGVGAQIDIALGGKTDDLHGSPLALSAYVKALHDGRLTLQAMAKGARINYGPLARLQVDGFEIIVASRRSQTFDTEPFLALGVDVRRLAVVALKSSNHFRAGFEPLARAVITADPPGLTTHQVAVFPRRKAVEPLWPLDPKASYTP